ncbi:MAG: hypothetical protein ACFFCW_17220 [Candidatus Hodarchaeota archaeon]
MLRKIFVKNEMFNKKVIFGGILFLNYLAVLPLPGQNTPWYVFYKRAIQQIERGAYQNAITNLNNAVKLKDKPQRMALTTGTQTIDYFPYFYLGTAHFYQARMDSALYFYDKSEQFNEIKKSDYYHTLKTLREISKEFINFSKVQLIHTKFETGLTYYLRRDFSKALQNFDEVLREQPNHPFVPAFISRIEKEIIDRKENRETQPTTIIEHDTVRITFTSNPSLAITPLDSLTKQDTLFLRGKAVDDVGIDFVQITINGVISTIHSSRQGNSKALDFLKPIPLNIGINNLYVKVFDKEFPSRTSSVSYKIIRYPPIPPSIRIEPFDLVSKKDTLILKGQVYDTLAIGFIQLIINGETSTIYPTPRENSKLLQFEKHVTLNVGSNSIRVSAYDNDSQPRASFKEYTVKRYIPWYEKSIFVIPIMFVLLFPPVLLLLRWIKRAMIKIKDIPNPYVFGPPIEDRSKFYGREEFLRKIEDALARSSVIVKGERRIGKTSVLRRLKYRLKRPMYPILMSMEQVASESSFLQDLALGIFRASSEYLFDIAEEQMNRIRDKGHDYGSFDLFEDLTWIIGKFKELDPQAKLIILMDEVDRTNNWDPSLQQNLRGIFLQHTAEVRMVLAGVRIVDRVLDDKTSPWYNPCRHFVLEPLTEHECRELITEPAKGFNYHEDAIAYIKSKNECKPHFVQMTCSYAFEIAQHHRTKDITYEMVQKAFDKAVDEYSTVMEAVWATLPLELRRTFQLGRSIDGSKYTSEINRLVEMSMCSRNPLKRKVVPSPIFERWIERSKNA